MQDNDPQGPGLGIHVQHEISKFYTVHLNESGTVTSSGTYCDQKWMLKKENSLAKHK